MFILSRIFPLKSTLTTNFKRKRTMIIIVSVTCVLCREKKGGKKLEESDHKFIRKGNHNF